MQKKVSLKDIARKVGVSTALVSYVLNNQKENRIGKEVAQKIRKAAQELNYHTNQIARSLKTKRTNTIGLIVADISNPFFSTLARIIEDEAAKNKYTVLFGSSDESAQKMDKLIHLLLNHQVDGFIIAASESSEEQITYLLKHHIPFVLIDRYFPALEASYVAIDNYKAAYAVVNHFIDEGSNRVGLISYQSSLFHLQERKRGYSAALKENTAASKKAWIKEIHLSSDNAAVEKAIDTLLSLPEPVEAILFASNKLSTWGLKYLNSLRIKVPDDLAVASFDESDAADLFYAPLTHIKQPLEAMGQAATQSLLKSISQKAEIISINMEAALVVRSSSFSKSKLFT